MIDKETAIELAKEAGGLLTEFGINCTKGMRFHNLDTLASLCNLAVAHAQKDAEPVAIPDCGEAGHADGCCGNLFCLPRKRTIHDDTAPKLPFPEADLTGVSVCCGDYAHCGRPCTPRGRWQASIDDTALLRMALESLDDSVGLVVNDASQAEELYGRYPTRQARIAEMKKIADDHQAAITALRERLGEKT